MLPIHARCKGAFAHTSCALLGRLAIARPRMQLSWRVAWSPYFHATYSDNASKRKQVKSISEKGIQQSSSPKSRQPLKKDGSVAKSVPQGTSRPSTSARTEKVAPSAPSTAGDKYPLRLAIYHTGTGLAYLVVSFKFLAILVFIFSSFAIAPAYYLSPLEPTWMAAVALGTGAIPMVLMVFMAPHYVTYVHLTLPQFTRISRDRLLQFAQRLPPSAVLDITTMNWLWARVTRVNASELYLKQSPTGSYRLLRNVPKEVYAARRWYDRRPIKTFLVAGKGGKVRENNIWPEVLDCIRRGWGKDPRLGRLRAVKP